jgi:hypothetical protein
MKIEKKEKERREFSTKSKVHFLYVYTSLNTLLTIYYLFPTYKYTEKASIKFELKKN